MIPGLLHSVVAGMQLAGAAPPASTVPPPTWHGGIDSLVAARCGDCHVPDGAAPFVLASPEDFRPRRTFVAEVVGNRLMPPRLVSGGRPVHGDRTVPETDRAALLAWLAAGCPTGDPPSGPLLAEEPTDARPLDASKPPPRLPLRMRSPWTVPAEGGVRWYKAERDKRTFVLPVGNAGPLRVRALDYRSTAPQTLGAVAFSADPTGDGRRMVDWDEEPGSYMMADIRSVPAGAMGIVGPGGGRLEYPEGFYVPVPPGSDVLSEVHYRPQGRERVLDDTLVLETLPKGAPGRPLLPVNLMVPRVTLAPGETRRYANELTLPVAVDVVALTPRASARCRSLRLEARLPGSEAAVSLLEIDDWNPHYRSTLVLKEPFRLPAGTVVRGAWDYDNSAANPRNPVVPPEATDLGARSGAMNVLLLSAPVERREVRELMEFIEVESRRNRG